MLPELLLIIFVVLALVWGLYALHRRLDQLGHQLGEDSPGLSSLLETHHRELQKDMQEGLMRQGDRLSSNQIEAGDRLREAVTRELTMTREQIEKLRVDMLERLVEKSESLLRRVDERLDQISGKVTERLDEGFKKTNETFISVMQRLSTIDEAQKKIDGLATNVVSLQSLLGDKRARGAIGEVQLEDIVRNILPPNAYQFQCVLSTGVRVDCLLRLPDPTGNIGVDSKFPLENYSRLIQSEQQPTAREGALRQFRTDVKAHVDAIADKYIIPGETSEGALLFVPAEAIFAEIHGSHPDLVEYAMKRRVWIVSPTTLMAILNTVHTVLKNVETRKQVHIIQEALSILAVDFGRFEERMKKLAMHIKQASNDVDEVHISSQKISRRFGQIHRVELQTMAEDNLLEPGTVSAAHLLAEEGDANDSEQEKS
ncbi:MAG: DNA recombination protein RmuC [Burkholderiales bacterium]|nr:DNA recombination protein RmuC [Ferrovum sp.]